MNERMNLYLPWTTTEEKIDEYKQ